MGTPSIYVYDCNNAGIIVNSFKNFAEQHEKEYAEQIRKFTSNSYRSKTIIKNNWGNKGIAIYLMNFYHSMIVCKLGINSQFLICNSFF